MKTIVPQIRRAPLKLPPAPTAPVSVNLRIDALVLHDFTRADGHRATTAFQSELTRLITARGLPEFSDSSADHLDAGTIRASSVRPELTGTRAARAIHRGLRA